jgi:hypothetical protein
LPAGGRLRWARQSNIDNVRTPSGWAAIRSAPEGRSPAQVRCGDGVERGPARAIAPGLVAFLGEVHAQGVDLYLDRQGVDTTTPGGKALFQMMGVFAEFEREMIRERVCAGLDKARAKGKRLGRPKVPLSIEHSIRAARQSGKGQLAIARDLGLGVSTVRRVLGATGGA